MTAVPFNDLLRAYDEQRQAITSALQRVAESGWYVHGPEHADFERGFAEFIGVDYCAGVASGTDGLMLALQAVTAGRQGAVVTAANAGGYTSTAARSLGLSLIYADVNPDTLCLDVNSVRAVVEEPVAAVVLTHLYGRMGDAEGIAALCRERGIPLVEDCAQSVGAERHRQRSGSFGDIATFSFYPTKNLGALGDGGAVVTSNESLAQSVRRLRQYGWSDKYLVSQAGGRNSRLDEMQAAVLNVRLSKVDEWNARRRAIIQAYSAVGRATSPLKMLTATGRDHTGHLAVALVDDRDATRAMFSAAGVATDVHYPMPDHLQPAFSSSASGVRLPVTERVSERILSLPCFPQMTDHEIERVCDVIARV